MRIETVPAELPVGFKNQQARHREYKQRGSRSRFPDNPGATRAKLASRFAAAGPVQHKQPPSPSPPSQPPSAPQAGPSRRSSQRIEPQEQLPSKSKGPSVTASDAGVTVDSVDRGGRCSSAADQEGAGAGAGGEGEGEGDGKGDGGGPSRPARGASVGGSKRKPAVPKGKKKKVSKGPERSAGGEESARRSGERVGKVKGKGEKQDAKEDDEGEGKSYRGQE